MSMRNHGIESKCFMLKAKDMIKLVYDNRNNMKNFDFENIESDNDIDFNMISDCMYRIDNGCYFGDVDGSFMTYEDEKMIYLDNEDIVIIELENDTLFKKYDNITQIYDEIRERLKELEIIVDNTYISKHFGTLRGSYYA